MYQNHHSPSWKSATQPKSSQLSLRPLAVGGHSVASKPSTQEQTEKEAFGQDKLEASQLQLKAESDQCAPAEQQQLSVLQAQMNDFWIQRREKASRFGHNIANIPVSTPHQRGSALQSKSAIQAKLTIGQPGDKYEQEADSVAAKVVNQINSPQFQQQGQAVQHQEGKEENLQAKSILQRRQAPIREEASTNFESDLNRAKGSGQSLDKGLQQSMGQAMGADFSGVKVHTDAQSDQLNKSIQARAFATGQNVFFKRGEYNPRSRGGQELIAHELTHVVQQSGGAVQRLLSPEEENCFGQIGQWGQHLTGTVHSEGTTKGIVQRTPSYKSNILKDGKLEVTERDGEIKAEGSFINEEGIEKKIKANLTYKIDDQIKERLIIKNLMSFPKRTGVGSLLVYHLALIAVHNQKTVIGTDTSALEEGTPDFYQRIGLVPEPSEELEMLIGKMSAEANKQDEAEAEKSARAMKNMLWAGRLNGKTQTVLDHTWEQYKNGKWDQV